jgi:hypothetical protein
MTKASEHREDDDAFLHIQDFTSWVDLNGVPDKKAALAFRNSIKHRMHRLWFEQQDQTIQNSYERIKAAFLEAFDEGRPDFFKMAMSEMPKQKANEKVKDFYERYFKQFNRIKDKDQLMLNFVKNLRGPLKNKVLNAQENHHVKNLTEAYKIASKWESVEEDMSGTSAKEESNSSTRHSENARKSTGDHEAHSRPTWAKEILDKQKNLENKLDTNRVNTIQEDQQQAKPVWAEDLIQGQMYLKNKMDQNNVDSQEKVNILRNSLEARQNSCYQCGSFKHMIKECPESRRKPQDAQGCFNCNSPHHSVRDCPNINESRGRGGRGGGRAGRNNRYNGRGRREDFGSTTYHP